MSLNPDSQITVPPSFEAIYRDARGRPTLPAAEFLQRYELCEDTAQALVEPSQQRLHGMGLSEDVVLDRTRAALAAGDGQAGAGFSPTEAHWVATRLAELLGWDWEQALPAPADRATRASRLA